MKLISAREAIDFLSQAAPRPWVRRLLRWMAFDQELDAYSSSGYVQAHSTVFKIIIGLHQTAGELSGPKMEAAIREEYEPEFAEKLIGKNHYDRVDDDPVTWSESGEPRTIDPGFFMYTTEIDWENGVLKAEWLPGDSERLDVIFPSDDLFGTDFDDAEFEAEIRGLSFDFSQIELLLPSIELRPSSGFVPDGSERTRPTGRPPKWNWDDAMAYVVSQAQLPDGLPTGPGAQARIEEMITGWFMGETGDAPAASQVRQRAATIMTMLEKAKKPKIT